MPVVGIPFEGLLAAVFTYISGIFFQNPCHSEEIEAAYFFHLKNAFGKIASFLRYLRALRCFSLCPPRVYQIGRFDTLLYRGSAD